MKFLRLTNLKRTNSHICFSWVKYTPMVAKSRIFEKVANWRFQKVCLTIQSNQEFGESSGRLQWFNSSKLFRSSFDRSMLKLNSFEFRQYCISLNQTLMKPMKYRISKYGFVLNNGRGDLIVSTKIHWTFKICFVLKPQWLMRIGRPLYYLYISIIQIYKTNPREKQEIPSCFQKHWISNISSADSHSWCNLLLISASFSTFLSATRSCQEKLTTGKKTGAARKKNVFIISTMMVTSSNECSVENVVKTAN